MVQRLRELKESLREHYRVGRTLNERLEDAIAAEQYELAAQLRDEIAKRGR
jgi:protein-arginine kinase activator protein McsA